MKIMINWLICDTHKDICDCEIKKYKYKNWEGKVYMISGSNLIYNLLGKDFFKMPPYNNWINNNGFLIIKASKFEKKFPNAKKMKFEIYDKSEYNLDKLKKENILQ